MDLMIVLIKLIAEGLWSNPIFLSTLLGVIVGGAISFGVTWYFRQREEEQHLYDRSL
jgi:uncharacterized membrane protein YgaE (UPF0421/DUF939 family)